MFSGNALFTVPGIVGLLSRDFIRLVALALLIAAPVAWYFLDRWLEGFAYRIELGAWSFLPFALLTGLAMALLAFLTVGVQAVRAAYANPVESLRSE